MTSPTHDRFRSAARWSAIFLIAAAVSVAGCEKKKKKAPPPPPPPPPPKVVIPDPVDSGAVLQSLRADARVQFPQEVSPADRSLAEGAVKIADALAKGDAPGLRKLLDGPSQSVLDELVSSGGWAEGTKPIEQVRIVAVSGIQEARPESSVIGMAVQGRDGAYLLAWSGRRNGEGWLFSAAPCQSDVHNRASEFDGVSIEMGSFNPAGFMPPSEPTASKGSTPNRPSAPPPEPERNPNRKNTPAGPITIPSPGGT